MHAHPIQIYYEDTDLSGVVYHANYLKSFERAREHVIGADRLVALLAQNIGFVVHKVSLTFKEGARLGDVIEIRSSWRLESKYRVVFHQAAWKGATLLAEGEVEMVTVDGENRLVPLPEW